MGIPGSAIPLLLRRAAAAGDDAYEIKKSLRINGSGDDAILRRPHAGNGNRRTYTIAFWIKRGPKHSNGNSFLGQYGDGAGVEFQASFDDTNDKLTWYYDASNYVQTSRSFRDYSSWYHIVFAVDTTLYEDADRIRVYVNGERQTLSTYNAPSHYADTDWNCIAGEALIGGRRSGQSRNFQWADFRNIDGRALHPSAFLTRDSSGVVHPKAFSIATINDGTTWSTPSYWSGTEKSDAPYDYAFDGNLGSSVSGTSATIAKIDNSSTTGQVNYDFTPPNPITFIDQVEICGGISGARYSINGEPWVLGANTGAWQTIASGGGTLTTLNIEADNHYPEWRGVRVDGVVLLDGVTDSDAHANPNNGTTWSNSFAGGNFNNTYPGTLAFDGKTTTMARPDTSQTITWTAPTSIPFTQLEFCGWNDNISDGVVINGVNISSTIAGTTAEKWNDITSLITSPLSTIVIKGDSGTNKASFRGVKIDGHVLIDSNVDNSFHLTFEDDSADRYLGKDTLKGKIADATGGLPIYKTTDDYGLVKGSGHRADSNASSLVLAVPGDAIADVSHSSDLRNSGSALSLTNNGTVAVTTDHSHFYGSALSFNGSNKWLDIPSISTNNNNKYCIECWVKHKQDAEQQIIEFKSSDSSGDYMYIQQNTSEGYRFRGGGLDQSTANSFARDGDWVHVAYTNDGSNARAFVNGVLVGEADSTSWTIQSTLIGAIGAGADSDHSQKFNGYLQDLRVYFGIAKYTAAFTAPKRNEFTPVNISATTGPTAVSLASATGGKPIWVTTGEGATKSSPEDAVDPDNDNEGTDIKSYIKWAIAGDGADGTTITHAETNHASDIYSSYSNPGATPDIIGNPNWSTTTSRYYGSSLYWDGDDRLIFPLDAFGTNDFTIEFWLNHAGPSGDQGIFGWSSSGQSFAVSATTDGVEWKAKIGSSTSTIKASIDNSVWTHYAIVRDKGTYIKIYKNGVEQDSSTSDAGYNTNIAAASSGYLYTMGAVDWRANGGSLGSYLTGYLQDFRIYSTRKYKANFTVPVKDVSSEIDSFVDSPTNYAPDTGDDADGAVTRGNYCVWNYIDNPGSLALTQGNLAVKGGSALGMVLGTLAMPAGGKFYWEITIPSDSATAGECYGGIANRQDGQGDAHLSDYGVQLKTSGEPYFYTTGNTSQQSIGAWTGGDILGLAFDVDTGTLKYYRNNVLKYTHTSIPTSITWQPAFNAGTNATEYVYTNFGQHAFKYTAPTGYKTLNTFNLPDLFGANDNTNEDLNDPSKYFGIKTYKGSGADMDIKGLNFKPDLVWMKPRSASNDHVLVDAARGVTERIFANLDNAESTAATSLKTFNSDGFTIGDHSSVNTSNVTHVAWAWDAGSAAATPSTAGNITISNQWVNTTSGFSISKYTMGADGGTFGHALGAVPDWVIVKRLNTTTDWASWHKGVPNTQYMMLNEIDDASTWNLWGDTTPTSTLVTVSGDSYTGNNGDTYIAYCWTSIPGYSSFGTYAGSGSGVAWVYTGFAPRFVLIKNISADTNWKIYDRDRDPDGNGMTYELETDTSDAEVTSSDPIDFNSNGFMIRGNSGGALNGGGYTYIYACFADHPLKTSRAR